MDARRERGRRMVADGGGGGAAAQPGPARIVTFYPRYCTDEGVSHTCFSLARWTWNERLSRRMVVAQGAGHVVGEPWVTAALPRRVACAGYRARLDRAMTRWSEVALWRVLREGERRAADPHAAVPHAGVPQAVWVWPGCRLGLVEALKGRGFVVVTERINCHRATARRILDGAYAALGLPARHGLLPEAEAQERRELELADYVFSPSPNVTDSLVEQGVSPGKVLPTSFGWDPARLRVGAGVERNGEARRAGAFTALFVGRICVRKGAHLLLRAWAASGVRGRLVLMGRLDEEIARVCAAELAREDVEVRPHGSDVAAAYAGADLFVMPTLEEGSPLVVYEALACGLPVVTTRMGAGAVVRHGVEGAVVEAEGLVEAIRAYAGDEKARREAGLLARLRAREYTWSRVGQRRAAQLLGVLGGAAAPAEPEGVACAEMGRLVEPRGVVAASPGARRAGWRR